MSFLSGKCDLCSHICGLGGWYDKDGNQVKMGEGSGAYYSDVYQDFLVFKKRTNGTLFQHKHIKEVNTWNQDFIAEKCKFFKIIKHEDKVDDKRTKEGYRVITSYTYEYFGKEYTAKELKKKGGVFITVEIHFNNLLELLPYFPYIVSSCASDKEKETVFISERPYPEEQYESGLQHGFEHSRDYYAHKLAEYTREVTLRYFNPAGREVIEDVEFELEDCKEGDTPRYIAWLHNSIDDNFKVEWIIEKEDKTHWTSPEIIDAKQGLIAMSKEDFTHFIGPKTKVKYVKQLERSLYLQ